jgi:hypothetical protein
MYSASCRRRKRFLAWTDSVEQNSSTTQRRASSIRRSAILTRVPMRSSCHSVWSWAYRGTQRRARRHYCGGQPAHPQSDAFASRKGEVTSLLRKLRRQRCHSAPGSRRSGPTKTSVNFALFYA